MADDPCEAAFESADPTGPRKYYRARYYDPKIGRFISEDPIRFEGLDPLAINGLLNSEDSSLDEDLGDNPLIVPTTLRQLEAVNGYTYVANNPANLFDATGEAGWGAAARAGAAAAARAWKWLKPQIRKGWDWTKTQCKRIDCRWEPHDKPNHYFFGRKMCHMQVDCWFGSDKKGGKFFPKGGKMFTIRIPRPWCEHTPNPWWP